MVNLLRALDLWRVVWEVLVNGEVEPEATVLVHAFVGVDDQEEVELVVLIRVFYFHGGRQVELGHI